MKARRSPRQERLRFRPQSIQELMQKGNLSPAELAERSGMQRLVLGAWSSGFIVPQVDSVRKFADRLGVSWMQFYQDPTENPRPKKG